MVRHIRYAPGAPILDPMASIMAGSVAEEQEEGLADLGETAMKEFCAAAGELILWANMIDRQLNQAILGQLALPEHPLIEPLIAQFDPRPKCELLKKRAKTLPGEWKSKISGWVKRAEKVNAKRNIVAHHSIRIKDGAIKLHSDQLTKLMDWFDTSDGTIKPGEDMGIEDILEWIELARNTHEEGLNVLTNLDRFRELAANK